MKVALVDYGAGNLTSVRKALRTLGAEVSTPVTPAELAAAERIIVPGVGHFGMTRALDDPWRAVIRHAVDQHCRLLGICLGMQWLFEGSTEAPDVPGLGLLAGRCEPLADFGGSGRVKIPHVGWNSLRRTRHSTVLDGVEDAAYVYFTHSYAAPVTSDTVATTSYANTFAAVVERGRVCGVQFHPEKSGRIGMKMLENFLRGMS